MPLLESVKNRESRIGAIVASGYLGDAAAPVMPQLLKALRDDDERVRERSIIALGLIGPAAANAVPNISRMLLNDEQWLSSASQALDSLSRMEPLSAQVWPDFVQALMSKETERRDQ